MAEFLMKKMIRQAGRENDFEIASAATSDEEVGNPIYPMARQELAMHGIGCAGHVARRVTSDDYDRYDLIVAMEAENIRWLQLCFGGDPEGKISLLMAHAGEARDVADPWYTRKFRIAWNDIHAGCTALLNEFPPDGGTAD
jgi:protein-tyrosine phosphatase